MNQLIDEILPLVKEKFNIPNYDLERILMAQWRILERNIRERGKQNVNIMYLGKFKPSPYFLSNYERLKQYAKPLTFEEYHAKKAERNSRGPSKFPVRKRKNDSQSKDENMQDMSSLQ